MTGWTSTTLPDKTLMKIRAEDRKKMGKAAVTSAEAHAKADSLSERELQNQIENWCRNKEVPIPCFRQRMDRKSNMSKGAPDFFICLRGRFVAVECKIGNNKPTSDQEFTLDKIKREGGYAFVCRSLPEFIEHFWAIKMPKLETEI